MPSINKPIAFIMQYCRIDISKPDGDLMEFV